jgi:hypothetical protein
MTLQQNQLWQKNDQFFRIVNLERMAVDFKTLTSAESKEGPHQRLPKKEFCRLLKSAKLLSPAPPKELDS